MPTTGGCRFRRPFRTSGSLFSIFSLQCYAHLLSDLARSQAFWCLPRWPRLPLRAFRRLAAQKLFLLVLAVMMIPGIVLLVPHFVLARQLNLVRTFHGLIIFYVAGGQPFAIFLITTFFRSQPSEMFESARVDGASELQSLLHIALPLARPILVTVAVMNFIGIYQDFIWPGLMLRSDQWTLMLALERYNPQLSQFFSRPELGLQAAGFAFAVVPQLFLFAFGMQYFIQGLTSGSVKG